MSSCTLVALTFIHNFKNTKITFKNRSNLTRVTFKYLFVVHSTCPSVAVGVMHQMYVVSPLLQVVVDVHVRHTESQNEALCLEILSMMRRCLIQQADIRLILYEASTCRRFIYRAKCWTNCKELGLFLEFVLGLCSSAHKNVVKTLCYGVGIWYVHRQYMYIHTYIHTNKFI